MNDTYFLTLALDQAKKALKRGEVPIGAVIVRGGKVIAMGYNMRERKQNALAHAEVIAIGRACRRLKSWRLDDCEMFVTLQPCPMCAGAILNARIKRVVMGALSDRANPLEIYENNNLNWKTEITIIESEECSQILKDFFAKNR